MRTIEAALARIHAWMRSQASAQAEDPDDDDPDWVLENNFHPPATEESLAALEATLGRSLPSELRSLLELHDGTAMDVIAGRWELLGSGSIAAMWRSMSAAGDELNDAVTADPELQRVWASRGWIPIAHHGGDHLVIDLEPTERGRVGQLVLHRRDDGRRSIVATGLAEWLHAFADDLEAGQYCLDEDVIRPR